MDIYRFVNVRKKRKLFEERKYNMRVNYYIRIEQY